MAEADFVDVEVLRMREQIEEDHYMCVPRINNDENDETTSTSYQGLLVLWYSYTGLRPKPNQLFIATQC